MGRSLYTSYLGLGVVVENQTSVYLLHSLKNVYVLSLLWPANVLGKRRKGWISRKADKVSDPSTLSFFTVTRLSAGRCSQARRGPRHLRAGTPPTHHWDPPAGSEPAQLGSRPFGRSNSGCAGLGGTSSGSQLSIRCGVSSVRRERRWRRWLWDPSERSAASRLHLLHGSGDWRGQVKPRVR